MKPPKKRKMDKTRCTGQSPWTFSYKTCYLSSSICHLSVTLCICVDQYFHPVVHLLSVHPHIVSLPVFSCSKNRRWTLCPPSITLMSLANVMWYSVVTRLWAENRDFRQILIIVSLHQRWQPERHWTVISSCKKTFSGRLYELGTRKLA